MESFAVFADGTANLPRRLLEGIRLIPMEYTVDGKPTVYTGDIDRFDGHAFFEGLRQGKLVQTSLINTQTFLTSFEPVVKAGMDLVCICMSSTISGTCQAAKIAAQELTAEYPGRFIHVIDSLGCGFGSGMLAIRAAELSRRGVPAREAAEVLGRDVPHMCQYFTVDDIAFLKRTGRVSGVTASVASVLGIKPILYGDASGRIVACDKVRGRKRSIEALARKYAEKRANISFQRVYISHGDCPEDAAALAEKVREITPDYSIVICQHEPVSGAHVGPGMLGLFFRGKER